MYACFQIEVTVNNHLFSDSITLHWHGMHQTHNVWMDGVPHVTQCPIQPGSTFTYRIIADPPGTHWYHSHLSFQRLDGLFGMLIIHEQDKPPIEPFFTMSVMDWQHHPADTLRVDSPFHAGPTQGAGNHFLNPRPLPNAETARYSFANQLDAVFRFHSILINGRGRQNDLTEKWPLEVFVVNAGDKYRFRVVHTGIDSAMKISVDKHMLTIVASDVYDFEPIVVESLWLLVSEAMDFEITADQHVDQYWIRVETIGTQPSPGPFQTDGVINEGRAILRYATGPADGDPTSEPNPCTQINPCKVFNCPFKLYPQGYNRTCIHMDEARSVVPQSKLNDVYKLDQKTVDEEIFLNLNLGFGPSINHFSFRDPRVPLFKRKGVVDQLTPCDTAQCAGIGCACTHIIDLPQNKVVQIVLTGYEPSFKPNAFIHPVHLHGFTFAVLKMGYAPTDPITGLPSPSGNADVQCRDPLCRGTQWTNGSAELNLQNPPLKSAIIVPTQGYTVIRINTSNRGYWLLHCHHLLHAHSMALILRVGEAPAAPRHFPMCEHFSFGSADKFQKYLNKEAKKD